MRSINYFKDNLCNAIEILSTSEANLSVRIHEAYDSILYELFKEMEQQQSLILNIEKYILDKNFMTVEDLIYVKDYNDLSDTVLCKRITKNIFSYYKYFTEINIQPEFDRYNKLNLTNQYKIIEKLYPDEADYYSRHRKALEEGYAYQYDWIFEPFSTELSIEECRYVWDVLDLHRALFSSVKRLDTNDTNLNKKIKFKGFDGNNETKYLVYAEYILHDLNRYMELHSNDYNTHSPTSNKYSRMLKSWEKYNKTHKLNEQQIKEILNLDE